MLFLKKSVLIGVMSILVLSVINSRPLRVSAVSETNPVSAELTSFGSGTPSDPWRLYTLTQLAQLSVINTIDHHPLADDSFVLMNDLDFSDTNNDGIKTDPFVSPGSPSLTSNWLAIGGLEPEHRFIGDFNGLGHTITGLTISTQLDNQGLFGVLGYGAVIHKLTVSDLSIQGGNYVGGIAGRLIENVLIHNVFTSGEISGNSTSGPSQVGGLIGQIDNSAILRNVSSAAHVFSDNGAVGGFVGFVSGASPVSLINAYFNGVINTLATPNPRGTGGFFGKVEGNQMIMVQNALFYGDIYDSAFVGYFAGVNSNFNLTIDRAYFVPNMIRSISDLGFGSMPYRRSNVGLLVDSYTIINKLLEWINPQSDHSLYLGWTFDPSINDGYPYFTSVMVASPGPTLYPGYGTSVIIDPLVRIIQRDVGVIYTVTILNPQVGDSLHFVNDGSYGVISSLGSLTINGTFKEISEFQAALRTITFSTTANPGVRTIQFTSATDHYYSSAFKTIIVPQVTLRYEGSGHTSGTVSSPWIGLANRTVTIEGNSAALVKTGHTFLGWSDGTSTYDEGDTMIVSQDMTLSAVWAKNSYNVVFKDHDGSVLHTQSVLYDASASAPVNPIRSGYHFIGWDKPFDSVSEDLTVNANYEPIGQSFVDQETNLHPFPASFADAIDFSTLELDPQNNLAVKLGFNLRSTASLSVAEKAKLDAYLITLGSANTIPSFLFDISLFKSINQQEMPVTLSNRPIVITITVPEAFRGLSFKLLRLHTDGDGVTTLVALPYTYNPITFTATFSSDQFSVFGFAYGSAQIPNTGENTNTLGFTALGLSLLLGLVSIKRRQKSK